MLITRKSSLSGITRSRELPITPEQWAAFESGTMVHKAFPHLSADDREFILTGTTQEEWDQAFPEGEED